MARALLLLERQADASWLPTTVILATPKGQQGKCLPGVGDPNRDARLTSILTNALPPRINDFTEERGAFEDWVSWGVYNLANGHTTCATEIKPEVTVAALYQREVDDVVSAGAHHESSVAISADQAPVDAVSADYRVEASERGGSLLRRYRRTAASS